MKARKQYLQQVQKQYLGATKKRKQQLLDEAVQRTELDRKYLIRRLSAKTSWQPKQREPRAPTYDGQVTATLHLPQSATGSPSYIDCLVMACADEHKAKHVFGSDAACKKNGYLLPSRWSMLKA